MYDELIFYSGLACNQFIPIFDSSKIRNSTAPWIKEELKSLIRKKKNLRSSKSNQKIVFEKINT